MSILTSFFSGSVWVSKLDRWAFHRSSYSLHLHQMILNTNFSVAIRNSFGFMKRSPTCFPGVRVSWLGLSVVPCTKPLPPVRLNLSPLPLALLLIVPLDALMCLGRNALRKTAAFALFITRTGLAFFGVDLVVDLVTERLRMSFLTRALDLTGLRASNNTSEST